MASSPSIFSSVQRLCQRSGVLVLMYHEVLPDAHPIDSWTVVRESEFGRQLEYIGRAFDVLSLDEAVALKPRERSQARAVVVTLDDGYAGNLTTVLPIAEALGVPLTVFVATKSVQTGALYWFDRVILSIQQRGVRSIDLGDEGLGSYQIPDPGSGERRWSGVHRLLTALKTLDPARRARCVQHIEDQTAGPGPTVLRPLNVAELCRLAASKLVTIGAHSHCHSLLVQLSPADLNATLETSRQLLEAWTGQQVVHFAYPNGDRDERVVGAVRASGFRTGLTAAASRWGTHSPYEIPRLGIGRYTSFARFRWQVIRLPSKTC